MTFTKGAIPWNKGLRGYHVQRSSRKGICFNTGRTHIKKGQHLSVKTEFGNVPPWNRGRYKRGVDPPSLREMYVSGMTGKEIGLKLNLPRLYVERRLRQLGIPRREKREVTEKLWKNDSYRNRVIANTLKSLETKPTRPERTFMQIIEKEKLPFQYVGDGQLVMSGLCPDFVRTDDVRQIIEIFGSYWHRDRENVPYYQTEKGRKHVFYDHGYETLIIWDNELSNEETVVEKVRRFVYG